MDRISVQMHKNIPQEIRNLILGVNIVAQGGIDFGGNMNPSNEVYSGTFQIDTWHFFFMSAQ